MVIIRLSVNYNDCTLVGSFAHNYLLEISVVIKMVFMVLQLLALVIHHIIPTLLDYPTPHMTCYLGGVTWAMGLLVNQ